MKFFICLFVIVITHFVKVYPIEAFKENKLIFKNTKVILHLDDYICSEDQWVYIHGYKSWISGNEYYFLDSAFISKGQHQVIFSFKIPCAMKPRLTFSKNGPLNLGFVVEQDSCLILDIDESTPFSNINCCIKAERGRLHNLFYELRNESNELRKMLAYANEEQADSIQVIKNCFLQKLIKYMEKTDEPALIYECFVIMKYIIPGVDTNKLFPQYASKFYWYPALRSFYDKSVFLPPSEEARKASVLYTKLRNERMKYTPLDKNLGKQLNLKFEDVNGKEISTKEINTPYIFLDFWASWCKPCRKEIPYIKQVIEKYKGELTIYAISLDEKREAWKKAIEDDMTHDFIHVIGTLKNGYPTHLLRTLDIQTIPANFLLDEERRIVAKDLRGEELMQTMDSLMAK